MPEAIVVAVFAVGMLCLIAGFHLGLSANEPEPPCGTCRYNNRPRDCGLCRNCRSSAWMEYAQITED